MISIIYVFNIAGELVDSGSPKELYQKYNKNRNTLRLAVQRGSLSGGYYFSTSKEFKIKKTKGSHNPLYNNGGRFLQSQWNHYSELIRIHFTGFNIGINETL